jgi:hypothetical protein
VLESPTVGAETAVTADDRAALLVENSELHARVEVREQRIRLLEEGCRMVNSRRTDIAHGEAVCGLP